MSVGFAAPSRARKGLSNRMLMLLLRWAAPLGPA
jgi:hypothetical protein